MDKASVVVVVNWLCCAGSVPKGGSSPGQFFSSNFYLIEVLNFLFKFDVSRSRHTMEIFFLYENIPVLNHHMKVFFSFNVL